MFPDAGPTARALLTLELLQNRPGVTAAEIADRLGVSERAARRTVGTLREVGVPVESVRGPYGGYRLGRGLRLPPLVFSATEALGLVMAVLDGSHAAAEESEPVGAALGKLIRALPEGVGQQAALMRTHAAQGTQRRLRPEPETTATLVGAVAAHERVALTYRTERGEWREEVDPWAVVVRFGRWYLLCYSHRAEAIRTYRVERVSDVERTGATFEPPAELDAVALLEEHLATGWGFDVRVVFHAPAAEVRPWVGAAMGSVAEHPEDPGRCVLTGSTSNPQAYAGEWLASIPYPCTVEGGPELRQAVAEVAERLRDSLAT